MKVGGRNFDLTKQEVESCMQGQEPELIQKHAVEVNGQMYPPKQVLAQVTGWERLSFTTMEAQRVLARIGFVCEEVRVGRVRQTGQIVMDAVRDSNHQAMNEHGDEHFRRGFSRAAGITLRHIQRKLDDFRDQMKGAGLSQADQAAFAHLDELRSEIEADCDRYWQETGVDWRPAKPLVKGAVRRASKTEA